MLWSGVFRVICIRREGNNKKEDAKGTGTMFQDEFSEHQPLFALNKKGEEGGR